VTLTVTSSMRVADERSFARWVGDAASAYLAALWGSLVVILVGVGQPPTLDATRPGQALLPLVLVVAAASLLGRGTSGVSGAMAGTASAYTLAIITGLRAAERNWAFIAPGPSSTWQTGVTEALLGSLMVLAVAAVVGGIGRALLELARAPRCAASRPAQPRNPLGLAVAVLIGATMLGGTSALVGEAAGTSIVLPAPVPTVTAKGDGNVVAVAPASLPPGEVQLVTATETCEQCAGVLEFIGPLTDADLGSLRIGRPIDDWINRLPRPRQLWYGGVSLGSGRYAFANIVYPGPNEPPRLNGVGILTVSEGPTPAVVPRTPGNAPLFVAAELSILGAHWVAVSLVVLRRRRAMRPGDHRPGLVAMGAAVVVSFALASGLGFYVDFAGSPF
jgi:hypothetical protein